MTVFIIHITAFNPDGMSRPLYLSSGHPMPVIDGQLHEEIISTALTVNTEIFPQYGRANATSGNGSIELMIDQTLQWVKKLIFQGANIKVYEGQFEDGHHSEKLADYTLRFQGTVSASTWSQTTITLDLKDSGWQLDDDLQLPVFKGTGDLEGEEAMTGKTKPLALGICLSVEITDYMIDSTYLICMASYRSIKAIPCILDRGNALTYKGDLPDLDSLKSATVARGTYLTCLALGLVRLGAIPAGPLVATIYGDNVKGWAAKPSKLIIRAMDFAASPMTVKAVDLATLDSNDAQCGIYLKAARSVADVIETIVSAVGGWWAVMPTGTFKAGLVEIGTTTATFDENNSGELERIDHAGLFHTLIFTYRLNQRVHSASDLGALLSFDDIQAQIKLGINDNLDFEAGDIGWQKGPGWSIIQAGQYTVNGVFAAVHDPTAIISGIDPALASISGIATSGVEGQESMILCEALIAVTGGDKIQLHGRAIGEPDADGQLSLRAIFVDGGDRVLAYRSTVPVDIIAGHMSLSGTIIDVPIEATHFRLAFVRSNFTQGLVGVDIARWWQGLAEDKLNALSLINGPVDPYAQANKPLFALRAGYDHDGNTDDDIVAVVGYAVDAEGKVNITHDNRLTYIPVSGVLYQPRAGVFETLTTKYMPNGVYAVAFDISQTARFTHKNSADRDMAAVIMQGDNQQYWSVGANGDDSSWQALPTGDYVIIGTVRRSGDVLVDADAYATSTPIETHSEFGATRLLFTGSYDENRAYVFGDVVSYQNGSYKYIAAGRVKGKLPTDTDYWLMIASGTSFLSGTSAPDNTQGNIGDIYLDTKTGELYQKTNATTWTKTSNLAGGSVNFMFKRASSKPSTPSGNKPTGWSDGPPVENGEPLWMIQGYMDNLGQLQSTWSTPAQIGGSALEVNYSQDGQNWHATFVTGDIYMRQRLAGGSWSASMRIVGEAGKDGQQGAKGIAGSQIYSGSGVPASSLGINGDIYLRTSNNKVYKKSNNTWSIDFGLTDNFGALASLNKVNTVNIETRAVTGASFHTATGSTALLENSWVIKVSGNPVLYDTTNSLITVTVYFRVDFTSTDTLVQFRISDGNNKSSHTQSVRNEKLSNGSQRSVYISYAEDFGAGLATKGPYRLQIKINNNGTYVNPVANVGLARMEIVEHKR